MIAHLFQIVGAFVCGYLTVKLLHWSLMAHIKDEDKPWK